MKRMLLTGMSGTGKSTIVAQLNAGGYRAIDADEGWSHWIDMRTGLPVDEPAGGEYAWDHLDWVWKEDAIGALLTTEDGPFLVVAGTSPNQGKFYKHFDYIVLLSAPTDVIIRRLKKRQAPRYGATPADQARVLEHIETVEPLLRAGAHYEIDTSRSLADVVADIVAILEGKTPELP